MNHQVSTHLFDGDGLLVLYEEHDIAMGLLLFYLVEAELHLLRHLHARRLKLKQINATSPALA